MKINIPKNATGYTIHFDVATNTRRVARNQAAKPPATRKIGDKRKKAAKHSKPLREDYRHDSPNIETTF